MQTRRLPSCPALDPALQDTLLYAVFHPPERDIEGRPEEFARDTPVLTFCGPSRNPRRGSRVNLASETRFRDPKRPSKEASKMHSIIYLVGLMVIVLALLNVIA